MSSTVDAVQIREMAAGEIITYSAWFGPQLQGGTLSSVVSVTQTSGTSTLTVGSGAINSGGAVTVDGVSRAISTVIQYDVTTPSDCATGLYCVTVTANVTGGNRRKLRCWIRVV